MKNKKTIILSVILAAVIILCSAVAITSWVGPKKIKVGVLPGTPMAYRDEMGEWTGYDIDFATKLFDELGYRAEFVEVTGINRETMLEKGKIDCYMSGTDLSADARFIYSDYYIESKQVLFHRAADITDNTHLQGLRVGVLGDTENEKSVLEYTERKNVLDYSTTAELLDELEKEFIDVAIIDYMYAEELVKSNEKFADFMVGIIYDVSEHTITLPAKNTKLQQKINEKIAEYKTSNYFTTLKEAYFMDKYYY